MTESTSGTERVASIFIDAPVEDVWDEIVKTGSLQRPLYNTMLVSDLKPGSRLRYTSGNGSRVFVVGEVIEVSPPHRFAHTYLMTMEQDLETIVTWDLAAEASGCRVTLTHSGWTDEHRTMDKTAKGWVEILDLLKAEVETGTLPLKTRAIYKVMGLFSFALPKRTSAAHAHDQGW